MGETYQELSTEELIDAFISAELRVPLPLVQEICNRSDAIPHVARILEDDTYWKVGGPGDGWSAIHALHLLGCMKTPEALNILIDALRNCGTAMDDWLTEDMPSILAHFGPSAIEPLKEIVVDGGVDGFVRGAAATALGVIVHRYVAYRAPVIGLFRQLLQVANVKVRSAEDNDYTFITLIVDDLAQFKDREAFEDIKRAFAKGLVDDFFIIFDDILRIYGTPDEDLSYHRHEKDPLDHFSQENIDWLFETHYETKKNLANKTQPEAKKKKIGRNDLCPCGSGKKYKKCCLGKDQL